MIMACIPCRDRQLFLLNEALIEAEATLDKMNSSDIVYPASQISHAENRINLLKRRIARLNGKLTTESNGNNSSTVPIPNTPNSA